MKNVNVTKPRRNLSVYLLQGKRGARPRIASHGNVSADLSPPTASKKAVAAARARLRGSVLRFDNPTGAVIHPSEWEVNR